MQRRQTAKQISLTPGFSRVGRNSAMAETVLTVSVSAWKTVETVFSIVRQEFTALKRGVNESVDENLLCAFASFRLCVKKNL
jgi:hypothetical protein